MEEVDSVPAKLSRAGWKSSQGRWPSGVSVSKKDKDISKSKNSNVSVAHLSKVSVARLQEEEMCQGAHSPEDVQDDVQKVVECQAHILEDVLEHGGGWEEGKR